MQSWLDIGVIHKNKRGAQGSSFIGVHACAVWCARYFLIKYFVPVFPYDFISKMVYIVADILRRSFVANGKLF